jgi:hypothetical protein
MVVLAVTAASGKAAQVAAFVQWALVDEGGYDLLQYGEPDRDYRLADGRVEFLNEGKPVSAADVADLQSARYTKGLGMLFSCDAMNRPTVFSARNYESLIAGMKPADPPIWRITSLRKPFYYAMQTFSDVSQPYSELISNREMLLGGTVPGTSNAEDGPMIEQCLARLPSIAEETGKLADAYGQRIRQLLKEQEGQ